MRSTMTRVLTCQGSLQFLTALSVLRCRQAERKGPSVAYSDHLVIYDIEEDFARFLKTLGSEMAAWASITFIPQNELVTLTNQGPRALRERLKLNSVDEIYICRDWQPGNRLMLSSFPTAFKIAYGDGIGYYFGPSRFEPRLAGAKAAALRFARSFRHTLQLAAGTRPHFDAGYFLLPEAFGEKPNMPVTIPDVQFIKQVIRQAATVLGPATSLNLKPGAPHLIFLPGNLAPRWTSLEQEVDAYLKVLQSQAPVDWNLIVKPHPRCSPNASAMLRKAISSVFQNLIFLEPPHTYIPMEVMIEPNRLQAQDTRIVSFTTACIPLSYLYGFSSAVGFGESLIKSHFSKSERHFLENEMLLRSILRNCEAQHASN